MLMIFAVVVLGYQTYDLNFVRYDNDTMPYVYAHTKRGFLDLIKQIEYYADKSGKGKDASIEIVSPDYWSMPWYMRDYPKAIFHGQLADANTSEMVVASQAQKAETQRALRSALQIRRHVSAASGRGTLFVSAERFG